jgi:cell wall-associated NlpC family hydrolase
VLELLMGTQSVTDFLSRMDIMAAIGRSDADLVSDVRDARFKVEQARAALDKRDAELSVLRAQAVQRKADVDSAFRQQKDYLRSIRGEIAVLVKAEQVRQAKLAAERARQARIAAAARARALAAAAAARKRSGSRSTESLPAPTGSPSQIVQFALEYLGVPYVWGGASPSGFDCSGLAQYVYARCGVTIPRTSREQFASGTHIPADRLDLLKPGDLVFFGTGGDPGRVHHVGIYCGSGDFIHAPATGETVRVSSLTGRISSRHDYVGGSRY